MTITGLPLHPLLVHLVVVLMPLTAFGAIVVSVWPAMRRRIGFLVPLGALVVLIAVPITAEAGSALAEKFNNPAGFDRHRELGERLLPWAIALFVLTAAQFAVHRFLPDNKVVQVVVAVLVIAASVGSVIWVVMTGDAGARLVWGSGS